MAYTPVGDDSLMTITLIDWQGVPLAGSVQGVAVAHAAGSAGISSVGPVTDNGDGTYEVLLARGQGSGVDLFRVTADDGVRDAVLPPKKAPLDLTQALCGNGVCELGEDCNSCPTDCPEIAATGAVCGNGLCEAVDGENCSNCSEDCNGQTSGKPSQRFCCGDGDCSPSGCNSGGFLCTTEPAKPPPPICCGDLVCEDPEDELTCAVDCGCTVTEDPEATCDDGLDNDCDAFVDCGDSDCATDPVCSGGCTSGQPGDPCVDDGDCCSNKCKGPSGGKTCR